MKPVTLDISLFLIFLFSFYALFMQGFAAPSFSNTEDFFFRVLAAASIQLFFCRRMWPKGVKFLPLYLTTLFALWGSILYIRASHGWVNATLSGLFADFLSPAFACMAAVILQRVVASHRP